MRAQSFLIAIITIASVNALPWIEKREDSDPLDPNGNVKLTFSKKTVQLGTVTIDKIFEGLDTACHETGQCETNDLEFEGQLIAEGRGSSVDNIKVTVGPDGSYPTWIRNGLLGVLKASVKEIAKCKDVTHTSDCGGGNAMSYCEGKKTTVNECEVPAFWGINYQDPKEANAAPPNIGADVAMEFTESTVCETTMSVLSAVAGAVNGYAGGGFSLLSMVCK